MPASRCGTARRPTIYRRPRPIASWLCCAGLTIFISDIPLPWLGYCAISFDRTARRLGDGVARYVTCCNQLRPYRNLDGCTPVHTGRTCMHSLWPRRHTPLGDTDDLAETVQPSGATSQIHSLGCSPANEASSVRPELLLKC